MFLFKRFSSIQPIFPPMLELSEILKLIAVFSKPTFFILSFILINLILSSSLFSTLNNISDKRYFLIFCLFETSIDF